jgi:hypothetical protein
MPRSLEGGERKWERKTANAGQKWKADTTSGSTPCAGLREEYGVTSCNIDQAWRAGVDAVSASDFQASINGKGSKWLRNYLRGIAAG